MKTLSNQAVRQSLNAQTLIGAIRRAFAEEFSGFRFPLRTRFSGESSIILMMPCVKEDLFGVKTIIMGSAAGRTPHVLNSTYTLYDEKTGKPLLFTEADTLTELRTAAATAVATDVMARKDATVLGIFGTGRLAHVHVEFLRAVRTIKEILVCGSTDVKSAAFAARLSGEYDVVARVADASECARHADIICACTTSPTPLFDGKLLRPGTHLNLVGAFTPDTREVDSETAKRSKIVVDTYEGALSEAGDLLIPMQEGLIDRDHVVADLHEAVTGARIVRGSDSDITLFKSVGCALEDLAAVRLLLTSQNAAGIN